MKSANQRFNPPSLSLNSVFLAILVEKQASACLLFLFFVCRYSDIVSSISSNYLCQVLSCWNAHSPTTYKLYYKHCNPHNQHNHHHHQNDQHHHCQHHHPPLPTCTRAIVEWCSPSFSLRPPGNRDPTTVPHAAGAHMAQALLLICSYGTFVRKGLKQRGLRQYRKFLTSLKTAHNGNAQTKKNGRTHIHTL